MAMTELETIAYEAEGGIAFLTINRPDRSNALLPESLLELRAAIDAAANDEDVRVLVLRAAGNRIFSAGIDLASGLFEDAGNLAARMDASITPLLEAIERNDKPLIASVRGAAVGLGASIVLACDLAIMAEDAELRLVFSRLGIVPDGGACWHLVNRLGYARGLEFALDGATLDAASCMTFGLANKVVPADQLGDATLGWARQLANGSGVAHRKTKSLMRQAARGASLLDIARREAEAQGECVASAYCVRAYTAFLDRRAAPKDRDS
jgi:2-(1,2-epoxy-1,2-dihydrophenyl)acetyl-CoA isomerase